MIKYLIASGKVNLIVMLSLLVVFGIL